MSELHVLNLGAGVQSTTLYLMSMRGEAPRFDYAIFADTQEEPEAVYAHLDWLQSLGGPPILVRTAGKLGDDLMHGVNTTRQRFAAIPAFTTNGQSVGQTRRQCSSEYKIKVIEKTLRRELLGLKSGQRIPKSVQVHQYFGISIDEMGRAGRIERRMRTDNSPVTPHFPFVESMTARANCKDKLVQIGVPHETPRSACTFCPYHSDAEWQAIKDRGGKDWERVIEIDRSLRTEGCVVNRDMNQTMYLHRACLPIDEVEFRPLTNKRDMQLGFALECVRACAGFRG